MSVYKRCDEVLGVRYWRVDYAYMIPRFEVFRVIAHDPRTGLYWFRSVKNGHTTIHRSFYQLNVNGFHPFCISGAKE
jgi:hypothetical protein